MVALQGDGLRAILVHRRYRTLARARKADANVGVLALARSIDDTTHHRDGHVLDADVLAAPLGHAMADVRLNALSEFLEIGARRAAAARAGDDHRSK